MMSRVLSAVACVAVASSCRADVSVYVTRAGLGESLYATYPSGQAINTLQDMSDAVANPVTMIRIFGGDSDVIGPVTIAGTRSTSLDVLIAGPSVTTIPANPALPVATGAQSWSGMVSPSELLPNTAASRVRLVASVSGAVTGVVDTGQVLRLQAGAISGSIVARSPDGPSTGQAIMHVAVASNISSAGSITALVGSIYDVQVGQGQPGDGLFGSVSAAGGRIESRVEVRGQISIEAPGGITARDGIKSIRCLDANGNPFGPVSATIDANGGHYAGGETTIGKLDLLECGALSGAVYARWLGDANSGVPGGLAAVDAGDVTALINISGDVWGRILVLSLSGGGRVFVGGDMYASVHAVGDISSVEVVGSMDKVSIACILPDIISDSGSIGSIKVGGNIRSMAGCGGGSRIYALQGIGSISCGGDFAAVIYSVANPTPVPIGTLSVDGSFVAGLVSLSTFDQINIGGAMLGDAAFWLSSFPADRVIRIGGPLDGTIVTFGPHSLHGRIISNANGGAGQPSTGVVRVGETPAGTVLTTPDYSSHRGDLGGGAWGDAPFSLHNEDCSPESDCRSRSGCTTSPGQGILVPIIFDSDLYGSSPTGISLVFKGPVKDGPSAQKVHVYEADSYGVRIPNSLDFGPALQATFVDSHTVRLLPNGLVPYGRLVMMPVLPEGELGAGILSDGLFPGAPDTPVADFTYNFFFRPDGDDETSNLDHTCGSADFNCDGDLGMDSDIEAFFACLAGQCPPPPCPWTADFNDDSDVATDADIEAFFRVLAGGTCQP